MSKMSNLAIEQQEQNTFVDDSDADKFIAIENKRKLMSEQRGYEVSHEEAEMHYWFSKVDERIAEINTGLRGLPVAIDSEDHPDQEDFYRYGN